MVLHVMTRSTIIRAPVFLATLVGSARSTLMIVRQILVATLVFARMGSTTIAATAKELDLTDLAASSTLTNALRLLANTALATTPWALMPVNAWGLDTPESFVKLILTNVSPWQRLA